MTRFFTIFFVCAAVVGFALGCTETDYNPSWASFQRLSEQIAAKYHQRFMTSGSGTIVDGDDVLWAFSVVDNRKMSLEQAKKLAAEMLKTMLDTVLVDEIYEDHFVRHPRIEQTPKPRVRPEQFGFRVAFWDADMNRPGPPYIAQIRAAGKEVYFYYADPVTQALQEPAAEIVSYHDLLSGKPTKTN